MATKKMDAVDVGVSLVGRLVATQFPQWADLPIKPVQISGWDNRTFRLGESMSVRLPSAEGYVAQVEKEHRWLPRLAPQLPLPIPVPLAMGVPAKGYPWHWSVYRWLEGENATVEGIADLSEFATTLAGFLTALQRIDPTGGPSPGQHNFFRGGPLAIYDRETRQAVATLSGKIDTEAVTAVWEAALAAAWHGPSVWLHGDVAAGNLLVKGGRLAAVIDFGCSGVGDPACDVTIAWTLLSGRSREAFRAALAVDRATWARGRGWALWKGLITLAEHLSTNPLEAEKARRVIDEVLADHKTSGLNPEFWYGWVTTCDARYGLVTFKPRFSKVFDKRKGFAATRLRKGVCLWLSGQTRQRIALKKQATASLECPGFPMWPRPGCSVAPGKYHQP